MNPYRYIAYLLVGPFQLTVENARTALREWQNHRRIVLAEEIPALLGEEWASILARADSEGRDHWEMVKDALGSLGEDSLCAMVEERDTPADEILQRFSGFVTWWNGPMRDEPDVVVRLDPDHEDQIIVFAGEHTARENAETAGYRMLDWANTMGILGSFHIK